MVDIEQPWAYFKYINSEKSYTVELGKHRLVMLDSGPDTGLPEGRWDAFAIGMGYGGEDKQTTSRGAPNSVGFNLNQLQATHIAQRETKGEAPPKARSMVQILKAGEIDAKRNEAAVILPVVLDAGRTVRANLTFDAGLLEAIDAEASRRGLTRSAFLASAARERLELA